MLEVAEQIRAWTDTVAADASRRVTVHDVLERSATPRRNVRHLPTRRGRLMLVGAAAAIAVAGTLAALVVSRSGEEEVVADRPDAVTHSGDSRSTEGERLLSPDHDVVLTTPAGPARLRCRGSGVVPVVMVSNAADPEAAWLPLIDETGQETLLCTFYVRTDDRAAPGTGDPASLGDPSRQVASALASTLEASALPPPFVLVTEGDAWGAAASLAETHPSLVGGVLMLDPMPTSDRDGPTSQTSSGSVPAVALTSSSDPTTLAFQSDLSGGFGIGLVTVDSDKPLISADRPAPVYKAIDQLVLGADGS